MKSCCNAVCAASSPGNARQGTCCSAQKLRVAVVNLQGNTRWLDCKLSDTIHVLKARLRSKEGVPITEQGLIYNGKDLNNDRTLAESGVQGGASLHLTCRMRGGRDRSFVDVTAESSLMLSHWSRDAPRWRTAAKGMTLEGACRNPACIAHGKMVIHNWGFESPFDLQKHRDDAVCPMCSMHIDVTKPGFNNCFYKIVAGSPSISSSLLYTKPWSPVGDAYLTYDELEAGMVQYTTLQIFLRPRLTREQRLVQQPVAATAPPLITCAICMEDMDAQNQALCTLACDHTFHQKCSSSWAADCKRHRRVVLCPCCRAPYK